MELMYKIMLGTLMVIIGGMMFLVSGNSNCDEAKNVTGCKEALSILFWSGQMIALSGVVLTFLVLKFTKGDNKQKQESNTKC